MINLVRAEMRKLTVLLLLTVGGLMVVFTVALAAVEQSWAEGQQQIIDRNMSAAATCPADLDAAACQQLQASHLEAERDTFENVSESIRLIAAQQTAPGAFSFVAGLMMTSAGAIVAFLLAAALVGGEWQRGTATPMFLAERRLHRITTAKILVIAGITVLVTVIAWAAVYTFSLAYVPLVEHARADHASAAKALHRLGLLLGMAIVWATVAVLAGMLMRSRLGALMLGAMLLGALNLGSSIGGLEAYTPFGLLADIASFADLHAAWDYLMARPEAGLQFGGARPAPDPAVGSRMFIFVPVLAAVGAALAWLRRMDLVE